MKPLILVTNDDGISAPGLKALVSVMKKIGCVAVIAPDKPQSGTGHAITINSAVLIEKVSLFGCDYEYSCSGTPVDCVKIAVHKILPRIPDLCVSGINHGSNSSVNVIYSGTMSAAVEGAIEGIPSLGFSLCDVSVDADFATAKYYARMIASSALKHNLPHGVCLNINIPAVKKSNINGIKICRQAEAYWNEKYEEKKDDNGKIHYWLTGKFQNRDKGADTDEWALSHNFVSVVPVQYDITAHRFMEELKEWRF
ncbi:MAG: 5'/3'-nucleotidase SurE [Bacteroidetes bacterium]|nr:5'/3'-nucleotidase SurE [Bacteroidota bacterium]